MFSCPGLSEQFCLKPSSPSLSARGTVSGVPSCPASPDPVPMELPSLGQMQFAAANLIELVAGDIRDEQPERTALDVQLEIDRLDLRRCQADRTDDRSLLGSVSRLAGRLRAGTTPDGPRYRQVSASWRSKPLLHHDRGRLEVRVRLAAAFGVARRRQAAPGTRASLIAQHFGHLGDLFRRRHGRLFR